MTNWLIAAKSAIYVDLVVFRKADAGCDRKISERLPRIWHFSVFYTGFGAACHRQAPILGSETRESRNSLSRVMFTASRQFALKANGPRYSLVSLSSIYLSSSAPSLWGRELRLE